MSQMPFDFEAQVTWAPAADSRGLWAASLAPDVRGASPKPPIDGARGPSENEGLWGF
jgi:hypothetical protein